jgi:hypothetical protein
MIDLLYILLVIAFFTGCYLMIAGLDRIRS